MKLLAHELRHRALLRENSAECVVLLKKDGSLPLAAPCRVGLYGNGARHTVTGGSGSGDAHPRQNISVELGLERAGFQISSKAWLDAYEQEKTEHHRRFVSAILQEAAERGIPPLYAAFGKVEPELEHELPVEVDGELCVYVLARSSGEGNDRRIEAGDILLTQAEIRDILFLNDHYEKFILVLNVGGVVDLSPVAEVKNILLLSQLGSVTGDVFADLLLGKAVPSGKLSTTWAAADHYQRIGDFGCRDDTHYTEGIYVGYRYFDSFGVSPLFPFGHGLSFTDFSVKQPQTSLSGTEVKVTVKVRNVGAHPGRETLQLYASPPAGQIAKPYQVLAAFQKTELLAPGSRTELTLRFDFRQLTSFSEAEHGYVLEAGDYLLRLGVSSRSTREIAILRLDRDIVLRRVTPLFAKPDLADAVFPSQSPASSRSVPILPVHASQIPPLPAPCAPDSEIEPALENLPSEALARLCMGAFAPGGTASLVGNSALHVAGAAGETTNHLPDVLQGRRLVMADGPAGLSLSSQWVRNEDGTARTVMERLPRELEEIASEAEKAAVRAEYEAVDPECLEHSYTTALPIETALAQSWSPAFCALCGDVVGSEMDLFGVDLWLAPAVNIHRDIRCGRNFEYFSEDPLLSGKLAAALTRGVQAHAGRGVTVKHFLANNQETNRYNSNSVVSEQALREIYLRSFEICIREGQPKALMTSYNLCNGVHVSECESLLREVLRGELGFEGLIMTDWITTGQRLDPASVHPSVDDCRVLQAGTDLIMPGTEKDNLVLRTALEEGSLTREALLRAASGVYRAILRSFSPTPRKPPCFAGNEL